MNDASSKAGKFLWNWFNFFTEATVGFHESPTVQSLFPALCDLRRKIKFLNWHCVSFKLALHVFLVKSQSPVLFSGNDFWPLHIYRLLTSSSTFPYETRETIETWFLKRAVKLPKWMYVRVVAESAELPTLASRLRFQS